MAGLKMQTGNSTAVVALLIVLAGIIGFTVVRISGPRGVSAAPAPEVAASVQTLPSGGGMALRPTSNPFKKSARFVDVPAQSSGGPSAGPGMSRLPFPSKVAPLMPIKGFQIEPMNEGLPPGLPVSGARQTGQPEPEKPSFVLLATVRSGNRVSAVLRIGGSDVRTVEVGDVLDGGYVVQELSPARAVLRNGKEIVIAER